MCSLHLRPFLILSALIISSLLAGGCKEDSTTQPPQGNSPTIISFTADPSSIPAGGDSVKLSWQVNNATDLSISPGIGSVTPSDSGAITIFVSSTTTFTLTASNSVGNVTAMAQVNTGQSMSVNGFVKDIDGEPISGVTVIIKGQSPTTTGTDGSFSVLNVISPYEVRVILSTQQTAIVYQGLTRSDPSLLYLGSTTTGKSATITGFVPVAAGKTTLVYFISGTKKWSTFADELTGQYSISADWKGSTVSYSGQLQVLRWTTNIGGLPSQYDAYGFKNLTISDGGSFSGNDFIETDFTDPAEQSISGSIIRPNSSYSLTDKRLAINFGDVFIYLAYESGAALSDNFSYIVPALTGATFQVDADAYISAIPSPRQSYYQKKGIMGGSSGITITLAIAPQLNLPVHNGTGIDTTTQFLWTQGGGSGINLIQIIPQIQGPMFFIFTSANSTTIPNLSPQGLGLPSNVPYDWYIWRYFPISTINDVASEFFIPLIQGNGGENGHTVSEMFRFTTHQ